VMRYAKTVITAPVAPCDQFCCPWYIECDSTRSSGTLQPISATVSQGQMSNGDVVTATVHPATKSVQFAVSQNASDKFERIAGVTFSTDSNLFTVSVADTIQSMWYFYRLAPNGLEVNGRHFAEVDTRCDSVVPHRKSVAYGDGAGRLTLLGVCELSDTAVRGGVVQVRAWVKRDAVDAVLSGEPNTIVTATETIKTNVPQWLHLVEHASSGNLPDTVAAMDRFMRTVVPASKQPQKIVPTYMGGYTVAPPDPEHYRLIPMKGDDYDFTTVFGQSVNSHHDTFRFSNEPGRWFVGATPSRAVDGLECALGYLETLSQ
jgi:hypothetical protein